MKISKLMTKTLFTVTMDDSLRRVKGLFENLKIHHVLVVENKKLYGLISDRDLLKHLSPKVEMQAATPQDLACLNLKAHQIMTRNPITLGLDASGQDAVALFNEHSMSCIPVLNDDGHPVGILTIHDILRAVGNVAKK
jgi:acetoin utilization protein AcuB